MYGVHLAVWKSLANMYVRYGKFMHKVYSWWIYYLAAGDCVGAIVAIAGVILAWFWPR